MCCTPEYVDSLIAKDRRGKLANPPGLYIFYLRDNIAPPVDFCSTRKAKLQKKAGQGKNAESARRARLELDYEEYRAHELKTFASQLPPDEYQRLFDEQRRLYQPMFGAMTAIQVDDLTHRLVCSELEKSGRIQLLSLEDFCHRAAGSH